MKKLKIAVWHNLPSGGGKRQLHNHVKGLVERGHYVESWCPDTADQEFLPLTELIREHVLPLKGSQKGFHSTFRTAPVVCRMLSAIENHCRACADQIMRKNFDVLFTNACMFMRTSPIAQYIDIPSAIYLGEPYRWFYEALPELPWISQRHHPKIRLSFRNLLKRIRQSAFLRGARLQARNELEYARAFDTILVNSLFSREAVLRAYGIESKVCYLGVDTDLYQPTGDGKENYVVGLGIIYHGKGIDRAIRAVAAIASQQRPSLVWIGNSAFKDDLFSYQALADELQVRFIPRLNIPDAEVISLLSKARAMIYTSRLEPFGLAPLEANACGTPAVAIAEGGVKETILPGVNGFISPGDDPHELARLLQLLIDDPIMAGAMGQKAREHVMKTWSMKNCIDNIENQLLMMAR
jgi:glycosyltransferase involved in cell wall biosynthesis